MLLGARVEPMTILVSMLIVSPSLVLSCGPFNPWLTVGFVFVPAVGVAMAPIEPMLGAVMHNFVPFLSFTVLLYDSFLGASVTVIVTVGLVTVVVAGASPLCGASGNGLFKFADLLLQCHLLPIVLVAFFHE